MKTVYALLGFALGASAALIPRAPCCFSLTASGGESGVLGQLADGQNRVGQTSGLATQAATYCLNNGGLTDQSGRGCILTPPTTQFQCDAGATPTTGFSVNSMSELTYMGSTQFYACATGDQGGYNIYTNVTSKQTGCVPVTLGTGGQCIGGASSAPASSAPASSRPASSATASSASSRPASSAPASSAPVSSATVVTSTRPVSTAPVSSPVSPVNTLTSTRPASSAPVSSAPVPSVPATSTVYSTVYVTVSNCASTVTSCPTLLSSPISTLIPTASTTFACNPAHSYPGGVTCVSSGTGLTLITPSATSTIGSPYPSVTRVTSTGSVAVGSSVVNTIVSVGSNGPVTTVATVPASSAPASLLTTNVASPAASSVCQTTLTGAYQTPHAIIPVNSAAPTHAYGTQYNATISPSESTIFNFDIPSSYAGKQCTVIFLFPEQSQLVTSAFTQSGSGGLEFSLLKSAAPLDVTWASQPAPARVLSTLPSAHPGMSYVVSSGPCVVGTESIEVSSVGGYSLEYFEDYNPSAIGLYITSC